MKMYCLIFLVFEYFMFNFKQKSLINLKFRDPLIVN